MTPQEKAKELVDKIFDEIGSAYSGYRETAKAIALMVVEIEYNSLREQLFNLRACGVIENENVYLKRIDLLNIKEAEVKSEIEKL